MYVLVVNEYLTKEKSYNGYVGFWLNTDLKSVK